MKKLYCVRWLIKKKGEFDTSYLEEQVTGTEAELEVYFQKRPATILPGEHVENAPSRDRHYVKYLAHFEEPAPLNLETWLKEHAQ